MKLIVSKLAYWPVLVVILQIKNHLKQSFLSKHTDWSITIQSTSTTQSICQVVSTWMCIIYLLVISNGFIKKLSCMVIGRHQNQLVLLFNIKWWYFFNTQQASLFSPWTRIELRTKVLFTRQIIINCSCSTLASGKKWYHTHIRI